MYYGIQSDIQVKIYCRMKIIGASIFNFELLDSLRDSIIHLSKKLLSFEFARVFLF